jgi:ATP-dependent Clp protease ATP-binding subunit ClpC
MFQRFTTEARQTIIQASRTAQRHGRCWVSAEDILLDLLCHDHCTASSVLAALHPDVGALRKRAKTRIDEADGLVSSKPVLELANDECRTLEHSCLGTGHLLLGLLRESKGVSAALLRDAGLDVVQVREQMARLPAEN